MVLALMAMTLFFAVCVLTMIFSKRKKAVFSRVERAEGSKFKVAWYDIDGEEFPCIFPSEPEGMYKKDRKCSVIYNRRIGRVFDIWSCMTCVLGFIFSFFSVIIAFYVIYSM